MTKSPLPADMKIRVLTTIENGMVDQLVLDEEKMVATFKEFCDLTPCFGFRLSLASDADWALSLSGELREGLLNLAEHSNTSENINRGFELVDLLDKIIALQKKHIEE